MEHGIIAAGAALHYLSETQHDKIQHINKIARIEEDHYVWLDRFTISNLELLNTNNENAADINRCYRSDHFPYGFTADEAMDDTYL